MEIMKQGEKYEESQTEVLEDPKPKVPKKMIIIGAAVVVIGIVIVGISQGFGGSSKKAPATEATQSADGFTDIDGNPIGDIPIVQFTEEEKKKLRDYGYTGGDIEKAEQDQISADYLIIQAKKGREELLQKMYVELNPNVSNPQSKEYKQLLNLTWLAGKPVTVEAADPTSFVATSIKENCRYVKIPARGKQLFVKLILESDGQSVFYNVTPQRYYQLKNEGNMVITYDLVDFGEGKFVTNIQEVPI